MRVIGDKNQISEDVFDFMISYLSFPKKSIRSELPKLFLHQYILQWINLVHKECSLAAVRCLDNGYVGKQPVAWKNIVRSTG